MKAQLNVLGLLFLGCGAEPGFRPVYLDPEPSLRPLVEQAIAQWEAAGVVRGQLLIVEGGSPVVWVDEMVDCEDDDVPNEACTWATADDVTSIEMWVGAQLPLESITHELGHALAPFAGHTEGIGMMGMVYPGVSIDAESLALVCSEALCL